ncbi:MerR family transcriptional regulator [Tolumonas osonensis]|uniref:DNA-binding transcriptional MerR regulator n=1 Tax=Tolumonas osonensis TaxID=675874 RepID=A0A841GJH9_9GAMM|nr:MerR family transcriptional regulator [Tolumonas osonensis]MBB6054990.1 DNA-binding transcriptional MerR regulator [Tolumonas osonensis]
MKYYSIKEFEKVTNISAYNLRFFDKIGLLQPKREANGYRSYALSQIAEAQMILILQQAGVPNKEIKTILDQYACEQTIDKLDDYQRRLASLIEQMTASHQYLLNQIDDLNYIQQAKKNLDEPFIESLPEKQIGVIELQTEDILDFFDTVRNLCKQDSWYLSSHYGFILDSADIQQCYPLKKMYCYIEPVLSLFPEKIQADNYMCMYSRGSLENNRKVKWLLDYAQQQGHLRPDNILIENVSGPVIDKEKSEFIIKIMIPLGLKK